MRLFRTRYDKLEEKLDRLIFEVSILEDKLKKLTGRQVALEKYLRVYVSPMLQPTTFEVHPINAGDNE